MMRGWGSRRRLTPEEKAANAEAKRQRDAAAMHCQICARGILANTGVIAHHGYERPDMGYQTQSCMGARNLPYEADKTILKEWIKILIDRANGYKIAIKDLEIQHGAILVQYQDYSVRERRIITFVVKSNTFVEKSGEHNQYFTRNRITTFKELCDREISTVTSRLEFTKGEIRLQKRREADWKITHAYDGEKWNKVAS